MILRWAVLLPPCLLTNERDIQTLAEGYPLGVSYLGTDAFTAHLALYGSRRVCYMRVVASSATLSLKILVILRDVLQVLTATQ